MSMPGMSELLIIMFVILILFGGKRLPNIARSIGETFSEIRKKTGFDSEELNSILEDLEKRGLMKIQKKNGLLGIKVELLPTEKGYLEFDS